MLESYIVNKSTFHARNLQPCRALAVEHGIVCWLLEKQFGVFLVWIDSLNPWEPQTQVGEGSCSASPTSGLLVPIGLVAPVSPGP